MEYFWIYLHVKVLSSISFPSKDPLMSSSMSLYLLACFIIGNSEPEPIKYGFIKNPHAVILAVGHDKIILSHKYVPSISQNEKKLGQDNRGFQFMSHTNQYFLFLGSNILGICVMKHCWLGKNNAMGFLCLVSSQ